MGTRNLTLVYADGDFRVAQYCQWDGYPEGQGITALTFARETNLAFFKRKALACVHLTKDEMTRRWKECGADDSGFVDMKVSEKFKKRWPQLQRDMGAKVLDAIASAPDGFELWNDIGFAADSLFCEWAYLIDLDALTFEVFKGFNTEPLTEADRFHFLPVRERESGSTSYKPIKLAKSWPLSDLPTDKEFVDALTEKDEDAA